MAKRPLVITTRLWVRATPAQVWKALTHDKTLARWYTAPHKHALRKGGAWDFREGKTTGRVVTLERNKRLVHTQKDDPAWPAMKLEYTIEPSGRITTLTIKHSGFGSHKELHQNWVHAWPFISQNLKTLLETGTPLCEGTWA
ncbi:MAG: SRPBCC domain-containing protein [Planctomycetes bacterium]|nr:SRPBCC domain-containing protein [Planctomycetota bacterium]